MSTVLDKAKEVRELLKKDFVVVELYSFTDERSGLALSFVEDPDRWQKLKENVSDEHQDRMRTACLSYFDALIDHLSDKYE